MEELIKFYYFSIFFEAIKLLINFLKVFAKFLES